MQSKQARERGENVDIQFNAMLKLKKPVSKYKKERGNGRKCVHIEADIAYAVRRRAYNAITSHINNCVYFKTRKENFFKKNNEPILA